jgi:hypothetical protein
MKTLALWFCLAVVAVGQSVPELDALRQPFLKALDALATERMERLQNLQAGYLRALEDLRKTMVGQGDLTGVLATKAELTRAAEWAAPTAAQEREMPAALAQLRRQFTAGMERTLADYKPREESLRAGYLRDLEALQKQLTQADKIEAALAVRAEHDRYVAPPAVVAPTPAPVAEEGPPWKRRRRPAEGPVVEKVIELGSGVKVSEGRDLETVVSVDRGKTFTPAVVTSMPRDHAVVEGTQYVKPLLLPPLRDFHFLRFKRTFTLPEGFRYARLEMDVFADDAAEVYLNGHKFGSQPIKAVESNYQTPASQFSVTGYESLSEESSRFRVGLNELEVVLYDFRPPTGVSFKARVTHQGR